MRRKSLGLLLIGLFTLTFVTPGTAPASENGRYDFTVYLNDKNVGSHSFEVIDDGNVTRVQSDARFKYTILRIPAYRYEHSNAERWSGNCLTGFDAQTNANGDRIEVSGEKTADGFTVNNGDAAVRLPECVMSFAYWNPDFLNESQLLNPQTGEYVDVNVEVVGTEMLEVRGQPVDATRFRLTAYEVDVTLWYSSDNEWLALESVAKGGHIIRYELS
jgi:hypothetical protein